MDCHCKDHKPGEWHNHEDCDCTKHEHPTYSFVITKVMEADPGVGCVFISKRFMETLSLSEGEPVQVLASPPLVVQARSHPNAWIDTRMISLDKDTMAKTGFQLYSEVRLRKASCTCARKVTLEVPPGVTLTKVKIRTLLERAHGAVLDGRDRLNLSDPKAGEISLRIVACDPDELAQIGHSTELELVDESGAHYISDKDVSFKDVGGLAEAVRKVREVVQLPLKHPEIFQRLGIDPPRGVLLHGPSGTGKTLIAKAVAGETGCYFKAVSGTEVMDKHYGESEAKLRSAFEEAYEKAPAIIFIDEIDALAPRRDTSEGEVEKRITAQLLALMDGMEDRGAVIVLAATNLPNNLDAALRRPGRFDREILIGVPDTPGRREIFEIHTKGMPVGDVNLDDLAEKAHGFVGADIKALCQEAGFKTLRRLFPGLEQTDQALSEDFLEAITVESEDFYEAMKDMRPSSGRTFEVNLSAAGWDKIAGYDAEIEYLKQMALWPMQHADVLKGIGVTAQQGLIISGPTGVGKTLFARSAAKASGFNVIEIRGPELISKYMGESERNIREVFRQARQMAPTVLILDGADAFTSSGSSDSKVMDRVINQMVIEMNSLAGDKPVLVVATANRPEDLAPALRATGRFGNELRLSSPTLGDRAAIFRLHLDRDRIFFEGDYTTLAANSEGFSGRDIEEACRRVILAAAKKLVEGDCGPLTEVRITEEDVLKTLDHKRLRFASAH